MTRRKKPPPQRKLQRITDSSGWTHIIKGPPGTLDPKTTEQNLQHVKSASSTYTLDTYLDKFRQHYLPIWISSPCFNHLSRILSLQFLPSNKTPITQCICLGLGSLTSSGSENSSFELAALVSMLEILAKHRPIPTIHFQDPIFTPLDRAILLSLNYSVLETPSAFPLINDTTFLFAPHLECQHYATALEAATPVLSVGSDVHMYADGLLSPLAESTKKGSSRIFRDFMAKTDSRPMPDLDRTSWCQSTRIYWFTSKEDDFGESTIEQGVRSMNLAES